MTNFPLAASYLFFAILVPLVGGLVAAPVLYAWIKFELQAQELI